MKEGKGRLIRAIKEKKQGKLYFKKWEVQDLPWTDSNKVKG